ncbi:MAG: hypothetical protein ACLQUY_03565 [Ktedonobacterales bacterium]
MRSSRARAPAMVGNAVPTIVASSAEIVRKAARGESLLHPRVAARLITEVRQAKRTTPPLFPT